MYWYVLVCTGMNWYVLVCTNLWSNEVSNHERKRQHEHFHRVTSHLGMFLTINVYLMEVGSVIGGHGDHRGVRHYGSKPV